MLIFLSVLWLITVIGLCIIFKTIDNLTNSFVSGSEHIWFFFLFFPIINTVFLIFLLYDIVSEYVFSKKAVKDKTVYVIFDGLVEKIDDEVAYVRLYDIRDGEESFAEIQLEKFPKMPLEGYVFKIHSDASITFLRNPRSKK